MTGTSSGPEGAWTAAFPVDSLPMGGGKVFRHGPDQVAVFRLEDGRIFAVDNRCPHEGYPLVQGACKGQILTCTWHNYKFDLSDGSCLLGDEAVRAFPLRVRDGLIELDLSPPDQTALRQKLWAGLKESVEEYETGRAAREAARLIQTGVDPREIVAFAAVYDAERGQWGTTHALPVAAEVLDLLPGYAGLDAVLPLAELLEMASFPHIRRPARPVPDPVDPGPDPVEAAARLRALVEEEQAGPAEALVRGAVARGWGRAELEPAFFALTADHFLDFGHALIYQARIFDLLDAVGWQHADPVLRAFTCAIALGTREDLLPGWAGARKRLSIIEADLPKLFELQSLNIEPSAEHSPDAIAAAVLDGTPAESFQAVHHALQAGVPLERIVDGLSLAASERLLRFDLRIDAREDLLNDWLDVTHLLTFCEALRVAVRRYRSPDVLKLLFQGEHFIHRARPLDGPRSPSEPVPASVEDVLGHIGARWVDEAVRATAGLLQAGGREHLERALLAVAIRDPAVRAIVVAHVLKTTASAFREARALDQPEPVLALVRFLAAPKQERRIGRQARHSIDLVGEGRIPRDLVG